MRLRDLAGLIVIDFIDMEDGRNDRNVEKRLHNACSNDRARIQIGKISQFGLLEMSRQRLRAGVVAGSTVPCPHCDGQGIVRSVESTALRLLRALEEEGQKQRASALMIKAPNDVAIYTLNQKRRELARIESEYGMIVMFEPSDEMHAGHFDIERTAQKAPEERKVIAVSDMPAAPEVEDDPEIMEEYEAEEAVSEDVSERAERPAQSEQPRDGEHRRGKRRRRRGGRDRERGPQSQEPVAAAGIPRKRRKAMAGDEEEGGEQGEHHAANGQPHAEGQPGEGAQGDDSPQAQAPSRRTRAQSREPRKFGTRRAPQGEGVPVDASVQDGDEIATPNTESAPIWSLGNEQISAPTPEPIACVVKAPEPETGRDATFADRMASNHRRLLARRARVGGSGHSHPELKHALLIALPKRGDERKQRPLLLRELLRRRRVRIRHHLFGWLLG